LPALSDRGIDAIVPLLGVELEPFRRPALGEHHLLELLLGIGQSGHDNRFKAEAAEPRLKRIHRIRNFRVRFQGFDKIKRVPTIIHSGHHSLL
jgi:hypothetical protein